MYCTHIAVYSVHCVHPRPAFVINYDVDTFVMPNVVANMTPYVDNTVDAKYTLLPGSMAVSFSSNMTPFAMNKSVCAAVYTYVDKFEIHADQELRASKDKMPRLSKQMEDREEDKERMKKLHKPQTTTLLPPRRVL